MLKLHKSYIVDENENRVAVQIPIDEFEKLEETIENFGLAKLIDETKNDDVLEKDEALKYYNKLKNNVEG